MFIILLFLFFSNFLLAIDPTLGHTPPLCQQGGGAPAFATRCFCPQNPDNHERLLRMEKASLLLSRIQLGLAILEPHAWRYSRAPLILLEQQHINIENKDEYAQTWMKK